ncbi:MAG: hypothetical protein ACLUFH_09405 [Monoglobales bacterium]
MSLKNRMHGIFSDLLEYRPNRGEMNYSFIFARIAKVAVVKMLGHFPSI